MRHILTKLTQYWYWISAAREGNWVISECIQRTVVWRNERKAYCTALSRNHRPSSFHGQIALFWSSWLRPWNKLILGGSSTGVPPERQVDSWEDVELFIYRTPSVRHTAREVDSFILRYQWTWLNGFTDGHRHYIQAKHNTTLRIRTTSLGPIG